MLAQLLDKYSQLCDEVEDFMRDENADLRCHGSDGAGWVDEKKKIISRIEILTLQMRNESLSHASAPEIHRTARDGVMKKLLKLLLLSRENEHWLLKNSVPKSPSPLPPPAQSRVVRRAYQ